MGKQDYYIKKLRGIYRIAHKLNGMCYCGQSVDMIQRWRQHTTPNKSCIGQAIAAEPDQFTFEILEECSKEELNSREKHWIEFYNCVHPLGYNKTSGGSSSTEMSEDTKQKIAEKKKGKKRSPFSDETKQKMSEATKNRPPMSEATRLKKSESAKGKIRGPQSDEHKQKISESRKGKILSDEQKKNISDAAKKRWQRSR